MIYATAEYWSRRGSSSVMATKSPCARSSVVDGHLHLDTRFDIDGCDLLDNIGWRVQIDKSLVDAHLKLVPCIGTLTIRCFSCHDAETLGRQSYWAFHAQLFLPSSLDEVVADLLERLDVSRGQCDADFMKLLFLLTEVFLSHAHVFFGHFDRGVESQLLPE